MNTNISISIKEINQAPKYTHKIKYKDWKQKTKLSLSALSMMKYIENSQVCTDY